MRRSLEVSADDAELVKNTSFGAHGAGERGAPTGRIDDVSRGEHTWAASRAGQTELVAGVLRREEVAKPACDDPRTALGRGVEQHPVEPAAVEVPANAVRIEDEVVVAERAIPPGCAAAKTWFVWVFLEPPPDAEVLKEHSCVRGDAFPDDASGRWLGFD